jgi:hypothetical protein
VYRRQVKVVGTQHSRFTLEDVREFRRLSCPMLRHRVGLMVRFPLLNETKQICVFGHAE